MDYSMLIVVLRLFREYEKMYTGDSVDEVEWHKDFLEFATWAYQKHVGKITPDYIQKIIDWLNV